MEVKLADRTRSGGTAAAARVASDEVTGNQFSGPCAVLSVAAQPRSRRSAPRETRTPTGETPHKALNLAGGVCVVSGEVQIVRAIGISRTIWTVRNAMDVASVLPRALLRLVIRAARLPLGRGV